MLLEVRREPHPCCLGGAGCEHAACDGSGFFPHLRTVVEGAQVLQIAGCAPEDVRESRGRLGLAHQRALVERGGQIRRLCAGESEQVCGFGPDTGGHQGKCENALAGAGFLRGVHWGLLLYGFLVRR